MAGNSLSQVASTVNENTPIYVEFITENTPAVRSDILAAKQGKTIKELIYLALEKLFPEWRKDK